MYVVRCVRASCRWGCESNDNNEASKRLVAMPEEIRDISNGCRAVYRNKVYRFWYAQMFFRFTLARSHSQSDYMIFIPCIASSRFSIQVDEATRANVNIADYKFSYLLFRPRPSTNSSVVHPSKSDIVVGGPLEIQHRTTTMKTTTPIGIDFRETYCCLRLA